MTAASNQPVPVWTLATEEVDVPDLMTDEVMTPARLAELRTALAAMADTPIATLEARPIAEQRERSGGIALTAVSPLAQELSQLVARTATSSPTRDVVSGSGEVLFRMVVPAKVAAQFGEGLIRSMPSKQVAGGVRSALMGPAGVAAHATFVPVAGKAAAAGAAGGSAATAGVAAAGAGAATVAAPLVLMAVAVAVSAHADHQRQAAVERITDLLERLHEARLDDERDELGGCREAIDKATSVLLDQGRIGASLGLDSAVHAIGTSIEKTRSRLRKWQTALADLPDGPVDIASLTKAFPGIDGDGGAFRAHLEIARLAIALKRRVLVLQAVEHSQQEGANHPFKAFLQTLQGDERRVDELERGISSVLLRLSSLKLKPSGGFHSLMWTQGAVDDLLRSAYRLRALGEGVAGGTGRSDVAIDIERRSDGSLVVFPAVAA
ncbi:hypothetical protein OF117_02605 [Geodermatophilus sp. YIM 151500]|nr:hypothetical protein [Geodermatophilus sp. YIM 151500]